MLLYSPIVTTASLCTALRISNETCTRDELIETYLAKMRAGRGAEGAACGASNQRPAPKKAVVGGGRAGAAGGKGAGGGGGGNSQKMLASYILPVEINDSADF